MNPLLSWPVAFATARERLRSSVVAILAVLCVLLGFWRTVSESYGADVFGGVGAGIFALLTLILGAGLLSEELDSGHAQLVLLRPITRAQWVGGRLAGAGLVLGSTIVATWLASLATAVAQGARLNLLARLSVLPLAAVYMLSWLAVLVALGAVCASWTNAGYLVLFVLVWSFFRKLVPLALGRPELGKLLGEVDGYLGPQDPLAAAADVYRGLRPNLGPALYDLLWLFGAWLIGVLLFNRRELARRRT